MRITISTAITRLGYDLAADLETHGFTNVTVSTNKETAFALSHGAGVSPGEVARLLDALKPFQPDAIERDETLADDEARLRLGDTSPLDAWEVRLHTDSLPLLERCREMLRGLGFRDLGEELGLQEKNVLVYAGAPAFARQVIRWQLRQMGLKVDESRNEDWEDEDDDIYLHLADPSLTGVAALERFGVEIVSDDAEAGLRLQERLRAAGFRTRPLALLSEEAALSAHVSLSPGPFGGESASAELARLRVLATDLLQESAIDQSRYPLKVNGETSGLSAMLTLPLRACRGGAKRAYDGPYPERFHVKIYSDTPAAVQRLRGDLQSAGYPSPEVHECPSLLDEDAEESRVEKGFALVWGAAGKQPEIVRTLHDLVHRHMVDAGAAPAFGLSQIERFHGDDVDVWIYFPVRGVNDGSLLKKLSDPARFRVKVYCPEPAEWADLVVQLERRGFAACETVARSSARPSIDFGAAPVTLIESVRDLIREKSGLAPNPRKCWNDSDEDIWIYLPNRPKRGAAEEAAPEESLDLHSWLPPVHAEARSFLEASANQLRVGSVELVRRVGPPGPFVPDLRSFAHFCLDGLTAETLEHIAASLALREPCLLEGETSTSKTSSILYLAALLNQPVVRINLNGQTDTGELVGRFVPAASSADDKVTKRQGDKAKEDNDHPVTLSPTHLVTLSSAWHWQDGLVVQALKNGWWVLLDEVNLAEPQILERLNSVLEREPTLVLTEFDNSAIGTPERPVHPEFRIFATMNPAEYVGRSVLSPAYRDRWRGYRFVNRPGETEYLAMLRYLVYGSQPEVTVLGQPYAESPTRADPPHGLLADWELTPILLPALARFHAALERAAGQSDEEAGRLGARRKERYVFTRRGLLSVMQYLTSPLGADSGEPSSRRIREAILRYYLGRVSARDDQALVVQLLDAAGLGPHTWSISSEE